MNFQKIRLAVYALYLTNLYGFKLQRVEEPLEKKRLRLEYAQTLLKKLKISVEVKNAEKLVDGKQYLVVSNHRGIIDPLILEMALENSDIFGLWISKKELYTSPFFGVFVRNAGALLLDREKSQMAGFLKILKQKLKRETLSLFFQREPAIKVKSHL